MHECLSTKINLVNIIDLTIVTAHVKVMNNFIITTVFIYNDNVQHRIVDGEHCRVGVGSSSTDTSHIITVYKVNRITELLFSKRVESCKYFVDVIFGRVHPHKSCTAPI